MVAEDVILTIPNNVMTTVKALGGILFLYLVFGIINSVISFRRNKKMNRVIDAIYEMGEHIEDIKELLKKRL